VPNTLEKENKKVETRVGPTLEKHGMNRNKSSMFHFKKKISGKYDISSSYTSTIVSIVFEMSLTINSRDG
jgi:hypothetical protein